MLNTSHNLTLNILGELEEHEDRLRPVLEPVEENKCEGQLAGEPYLVVDHLALINGRLGKILDAISSLTKRLQV